MSLLVAASLFLAAMPAYDPDQSKPADPKADSDPMVCHSDYEIGSRVKRRRICMRRSEWQAQRQEENLMINRTQVQRGLDPAG